MTNARDAAAPSFNRLLVLGRAGSGKTTQVWSLPGRKFAYLFDPNALLSLRGCDLEYVEFLPDSLELDASLKGFNRNSKDDKLKVSKEPTVYMRWVTDLNERGDSGFFKGFDWLVLDSLSLLANAVFDRQMWLNGRYGGIEDLADYRVVGSKIAEVFRSIAAMPINLYCTGHLNSFQDDKTKRIETQINLPGKARVALPMLFSNIWEARATTDEKAAHVILTRAEPRGFQDVRTTIAGLKPVEEVTLPVDTSGKYVNPQNHGIGRLLNLAKPRATLVATGTQP
jgi:hypothetical protein